MKTYPYTDTHHIETDVPPLDVLRGSLDATRFGLAHEEVMPDGRAARRAQVAQAAMWARDSIERLRGDLRAAEDVTYVPSALRTEVEDVLARLGARHRQKTEVLREMDARAGTGRT
jgi:hypothetical protein